MDIWRYILRRLFLAVFVLLGVLVITFILAHSYGNPIYAWLGKNAALHPKLVAIYEAEYHLNDPLYIQFYYYVVGLAHGDLGVSPSRGFEQVSTVIAQTLPYTLQIVFFAVVFTLVIGIALGVVAAFYYKRPLDYGVRAVYLAGYASPSFFAALLLLLILVLYLHVLPSGGAAGTGMATPSTLTLPIPFYDFKASISWVKMPIGIPMVDALVEGNYAYFVSALQHVLLPSLALALTTFGIVTRILRSSVLDVMQSNFIRTARAKGVAERTVFLKHGLRNAMIPVITVSSLIVTFTLTGTVFVENIFGYPGMGQYVYNALLGQDFPGILACTLIYSLLIVLTNLAADLLYVAVDPQIRLS